jgi:hypothetical protein
MIGSLSSVLRLVLVAFFGVTAAVGCAAGGTSEDQTTAAAQAQDPAEVGEDVDVGSPLDEGKLHRGWQSVAPSPSSIFDDEQAYDPQIPRGPFPQPWTTPDPK